MNHRKEKTNILCIPAILLTNQTWNNPDQGAWIKIFVVPDCLGCVTEATPPYGKQLDLRFIHNPTSAPLS